MSTAIFRYVIQCFLLGFPKNKRINTILSQILVLVIRDYMILHSSLLLYIYCDNLEIYIYAMRPLRDHKELNVNAIFGVRYTDLKGLPSGILYYCCWWRCGCYCTCYNYCCRGFSCIYVCCCCCCRRSGYFPMCGLLFLLLLLLQFLRYLLWMW